MLIPHSQVEHRQVDSNTAHRNKGRSNWPWKERGSVGRVPSCVNRDLLAADVNPDQLLQEEFSSDNDHQTVTAQSFPSFTQASWSYNSLNQDTHTKLLLPLQSSWKSRPIKQKKNPRLLLTGPCSQWTQTVLSKRVHQKAFIRNSFTGNAESEKVLKPRCFVSD